MFQQPSAQRVARFRRRQNARRLVSHQGCRLNNSQVGAERPVPFGEPFQGRLHLRLRCRSRSNQIQRAIRLPSQYGNVIDQGAQILVEQIDDGANAVKVLGSTTADETVLNDESARFVSAHAFKDLAHEQDRSVAIRQRTQ
jgi:hypothetical protein